MLLKCVTALLRLASDFALMTEQLIVSLIVVPPCLRYLERLWGAVETIKFIVVSVTFSNIIAFGLNWIEFIALRNADLLLYVLTCFTVFDV